MTGPQQHADTVRGDDRLRAQMIHGLNGHDVDVDTVWKIVLRWDALAERAATLERERDEARRGLDLTWEQLRLAQRGFRERDEARAEADRLREALREIEAKDTGAHFAGEPRMSDIARAALAGPQTKEQT